MTKEVTLTLPPYSVVWSGHEPAQIQGVGIETPPPNGKSVAEFVAMA